MKKIYLLPIGFTLILTLIYRLSYNNPWLYALSNGLFWTGLVLVIIGLSAIVDIIGLFKSFTYLLYKNRMKQTNKARTREGLNELPILDMAGYLEERNHLPIPLLIKILVAGIISWIFSFIFSLL